MAKRKDLWENDNVQFARLLSEMRGIVTIKKSEMKELCASMDLSENEIDELFERADSAFIRIKEKNCP